MRDIGHSNISLQQVVDQIESEFCASGWTEFGKRLARLEFLKSMFELMDMYESDLRQAYDAGNRQITGTSATDKWLEMSEALWMEWKSKLHATTPN